MASIFEISERWLGFQRFIESTDAEDLPEQAIRDTFDGIEGEIREKIKDYAAVIKNLEAEIPAMEEAEANIKARRDALTNKVENMKSVADQVMKMAEIDKIDDPRFRIGYRKCPPSADIVDEDALPDYVYVPQDPKLDKRLVLQLLKDGQEVPGAVLVEDKKNFFIK